MICFIWDGFPQYAARCVGAFARSADERVVVVASRPAVPIKGMEEACGCDVFWIDYGDKRSLCDIIGERPRAAIVSGWFSPTINRWRDEVRGVGGHVIAMCDNNWHGFSFRELAKALRFRALFRNKYDGFFVPGNSGVRLLRFYGVPEKKIATGLYAADAAVFRDGKPIPEREKKIICVARFIDWKNARRLIRAYVKIGKSNAGWSLDFYGSGPLREELIREIEQSGNRTIHLHDFLQPEQLAEKYRESRIFCLPSLNEHWGLVVHEGALSGCVLLLSKNVGAAADLLENGVNGLSFDPYDVDDMANALVRAMKMSGDQLEKARRKSLEMAENISPEKFAEVVGKLVAHA